ncbi:MAG: hypothetical protein DHS20C13_27940 [Thermodesulfobacteriota bacterium]|nr:MAG: hypothetical protein DHS20C13_27940 [Thermodesulfobacteriota bacterium]
MSNLNLTKYELTEITGKVRSSSQVKILRHLGIEVKVRPDGVPLVAREHYLKLMGVYDNNHREVKPDLSIYGT